ncbi:MAG TPA: BlaI/MecI/CopY family transcriptional regulator [Candidatus Acidoferrum sp.]|nr:BlaI/MecI/CopY family transcriptional regulator [Candidatus Acidoferrum sp.]
MKTMLNNLRPTAERPLGPLEQRLLHVLWTRGTATVRELLDGLEHKIAYTTAMTTLDRLYKKRLLNRVVEGRAFRYSPRLTQIELKKAAADKAIQQLLDSSDPPSLPLSYLVEALTERDFQLLDELQQLVQRKRRELRRKEKQ